MQLIESILILLVFVQITFLFIDKKEKQSLAFVGLGLLAIHFILGEARWQMTFIYLVEIMLIGIYLKRVKSSRWLSVVGCFFALILTAISAILAYALPVFSLPETTGPYTVGLEELYLKIDDRQELITDDPEDKRELMINVWYPSNEALESRIQYLPQVEREGFALKYGLQIGAFNYLSKVKTHSQRSAEPADGEFPVLIFSPGFFTPASGYLSVIEELVSHGYVVFNIRHPHETIGVEYSNGSKVYFNTAFNDNNSWNWNDEVAANMETLYNSNDENEKREAVRQAANVYGAPVVKRWAADIRDVIDALEELNQKESFTLKGQLNMEQLGVYGHSLGGAAALESATFDKRIKAAVNLDGSQWGSLMDHPLKKPGAIISSSFIVSQPDPNKYIFEASEGEDFYNLVLSNTGHSNFSDIPLMINIPQLNEAGSLDPEAASKSTNAFLINFFNKYLQESSVNLNAFIDQHELLNSRN